MGEKRQKENSGKAETVCKNSPGKRQVCAEKDRTAGGVITVFLSLILPVVLTVFATCLESARFEGLRLRGQLAADAAVQSVFAGYDRPLYERYGLLFVCTADPPQRELEEIAKTYGIRNTQAEEGRNGLLSLKLIETEASALRGAETEGGRVFLQAVGAYMQESGRMEAARIAAAEAGAGGYGQTKIALVEYLMREFSALTDEGAAGCQLEYCAAGTAGRAASLQEVQRRIYEDRYARYLEYFRERQRPDPGEGQREPEEEGPDHGEEMGGSAEGPGHGDGENSSAEGPGNAGPSSGETEPPPPAPLPEDLAREAAIRDVGELLNGGAAAEHADGSGRQLTYLQYLRLWLYHLDAGVLQRRAMEAIRDDLRSVEPAFDFSNCVCGGTVSFCFRSEAVMPFSVFSRSREFRFTSSFTY